MWNARQFRQVRLGTLRDATPLDWNACDLSACGIAAQKRGPGRRHIVAEWRYAAPTSNDNVLARVHSAKLAPRHARWKRQILRRWTCHCRSIIARRCRGNLRAAARSFVRGRDGAPSPSDLSGNAAFVSRNGAFAPEAWDPDGAASLPIFTRCCRTRIRAAARRLGSPPNPPRSGQVGG